MDNDAGVTECDALDELEAPDKGLEETIATAVFVNGAFEPSDTPQMVDAVAVNGFTKDFSLQTPMYFR